MAPEPRCGQRGRRVRGLRRAEQQQTREDGQSHHAREHHDDLARERFGAPVIGLNKLQASGLIDELIERTGGKARSNGNRRNGGGR